MPNEQLKVNVRKLYEAFNQGDIATVESLISPDYTEHGALGPGIPNNRTGLIQWLKGFRQSFPDLRFELDDMGVDSDIVWSRGTLSGTQRGEFSGAPATGKSFKAEFVDEIRFERNLIIEHWGQADFMGLMQQLGLMQMSGPQSK